MVEAAGFLVVVLDGWQVAIPLSAVERVARAVAVTPLAGAPEAVSGLVNVAGRILPVVPLRRRFGLPERALELGDHFVVAQGSRRPVALWVDQATGVVAPAAQDVLSGDGLLPGVEVTAGTVRLADGLLVIHDLEAFLSAAEEEALRAALEEPGSGVGQVAEAEDG
ncbi:MAG: chemotaxis protein CheW [Candidatus Latescibacterota bacterium]